jgi:hypothetical protein
MFGEDRKFHMGKVAMFVKTFGFYTFHSIFPIKVTFYHSFLQSAAGALKHRAHTFKCRFFWIGLSLILSFIYYLFSRPWDLSSFGLVWWFVCIVPFCNLFRIHQEIAERYVYLPNVGLMYFLASILDPAVAVAWAAMYAGIMWHWMEAYRNDYTLTLMSNANSSDAWFSWHVRAMKAWEYKSHQEAVLLWTTALQISPKEFKLNLNMASALMLGGHKEHALKFIKIAEDNIPEGQEEQAGKLIKEWHNNQLAIVL